VQRPYQLLNLTPLLLIDDEATVRQVLRGMLEPLKLRIIEAANGIAGLSLFREIKPPIVITDIMMPEMDGIETLRAIRAIDPTVKVIAMSAGGGSKYPDPLALARELGAAATLKKPVGLQELRAVVTHIIPEAADLRR
jgi:CheY-like chemotaxis protein